jgi:prepilin-type processing-associated H-X9-DG protein
MNNSSKRTLAFTVIELLVVLATLGIFAVMVIPVLARTGPTVARLNCAANLKQIGLAFQNWRNTHASVYPMNVPNRLAGPPTGPSTLASQANTVGNTTAAPLEYTVFGVMSNELSTPKILACPSDERTAHSNFTMHLTVITIPKQAQPSASGNAATDSPAEMWYFNNFKLSYFLGVNAQDSNPQMILAGDRNIWGNNLGTQPGGNNNGYGNPSGVMQPMGTNWPNGALFPQWSPAKMHQGKGNVLLADGSVQQLDSVRLRQQLSATRDTTSTPGPNTLLFP